MAHPYWPLFDLRVSTPRLELRYPDDDLAIAAATLAARGIHDPATMPFAIPWTDAPSPALERGAVQFYWRQRAEWTPRSWHLPFVVLRDGDVVGAQGVIGDHFLMRRTVETGSWVGAAFQGQGIGKEMRAAVLHFAFAGLGAARAESSAFDDNAASIAVSHALGYVDNGDAVTLRRDGAGRQVRFVLSRERWQATRRADIEVDGLEPCLALFGLD